MPLARFHHLTLESPQPHRAAAFWGPALGFTERPLPGVDGGLRLTGRDEKHALWVVPGPERSAPYRWHLDIHASTVDDLVAAGGHVKEDHAPWVLMHCPEHRELGVLLTDQLAETDPDRLYQLVIDSPEPEAIAAWWANALRTTLREVPDDPDVAFIEPVPGAPFESILFARESTPKTVPNSLWMTITTYDTNALELAGATVLGRRDDGTVRMADPDGNEFDAIVLAR